MWMMLVSLCGLSRGLYHLKPIVAPVIVMSLRCVKINISVDAKDGLCDDDVLLVCLSGLSHFRPKSQILCLSL